MIADFLQLKPSEELIEEIANKCEFQTMSKFKNSNIPEDMHMVTDVKSNHIIYRKGNTLEKYRPSSPGTSRIADITYTETYIIDLKRK